MKKLFLIFTIAIFSFNTSMYAWLYPEHRDIALLAIQNLSPSHRSVLDKQWSDARIGYESKLTEAVIDATQSAADLSWIRYEGGMTSYLELLDVQRSLFTAQLKSSETLQLQLSSIVRLYKALGGGWVSDQDSTASGQSSEENEK